jgi:predicted nucleic acid-binding protein
MEEYILDTNILIYLFEGRESIASTLLSLHREYFFTSVISHFEFLVGARSEAEEKEIRSKLKETAPLDIRLEIVEAAVKLQKQYKLKFKDLLIAATAQVEGLTLVTADKDFKKIKGLKVNLIRA